MKLPKTSHWKRSLPVFLITFLLINVVLMGGTPKTPIESVYAVSEHSSALYRSSPTAHVISGITVIDPGKAYDDDQTTYASFTYTETDGIFQLDSFTALSNPWRIVQVDFNMNYSTTISSSDDMYRILYYVDPSPTPIVLKDWKRDAVSLKQTWYNRPEPNDGVWDWADISSIRFMIETDRTGGADSGGDFKAYEIWARVTYRNPTVYVDPSSIETTEPFSVNINITNMDYLYSWEFNVTYNTAVLTATDVTEGAFLSSGGSTYFNKTINDAEGWIYAYCTLQGDVPGVTGDGILATTSFSPDAGGESALDLHDTKLVEYDYVSKQTYLYPPYYISQIDGYVTITLEVPKGSIAGTVTDASTELPIADATVTAVGPETRSTTTATDGTYLLADVLVGDYTVTASVAGYLDQNKPATVTEGTTTTLDFALEPITHTLEVISDPIAGIDFTINGVVHTTPWSSSLSEGTYTIEMPSTSDVYNFDHWEDMSTNPSRIIDLTSDMTLIAYYLERQWTLTVTSDPISGIDFTVDGLTRTTPWSGLLDEDDHTIEMPATWDIYDFNHWEDTSTNPTRTISLTDDTTITAYYVKRQWTLTVNSDPIDGIEFTINAATYTTPWSSLLDEGSHTVVMPPTWTVGDEVYNFDHWEDLSTDPSRVISLTADMTVTAYYALVPPTYWTLTVHSDPIDGVEFTVDEVTYTTPYMDNLIEGSHTVVMPSTWAVDTDEYVFDHWEDASTNPTRTISLTSDLSITAYYILVPKYWTLTVTSDPISGVEFTLDGVSQTTPYSESLIEGSHTIVMPSAWGVYDFDHWEDMSTDQTRTISLAADMTVTAYFMKRQWTLTVNSDPISGVEFTLDGVTHTTPWSSLLDEGSYAVAMPLAWTTDTGDVYQFDQWEDASTNPSRTVSLTSDRSITAYYEYVPKTYMLTVNSDPITGVEFTIDDATQSTPWTGDLSEGSHTIAMPSAWTVDADVYNFDHWEDLSTDPSRTISLNEDTIITAYYVLVLPNYWTLTVDSEPITGVEFTLDGVSQTTPYSESLIEGSHTIVMPSAWGVYDFDHWEDMSTNPTRAIDLTSNMIVTAYYLKRQWTLNVNSDPISGVDFTLDGATYVTPWSGLLDEGSYTVVMPSTWFVGADEYQFVRWEDMSTDPSRTVSLTTDTTITAYYEYVPKEFSLTVNSSPIDSIDFTIDDVTHTTNWTSLVQEGTHTIVMPTTWTTLEGDTYQFDHWQDDSTDPTRVIDLTSDMTLIAYYEYVPVTHKLTVNSDPITDVAFTIDGATQYTPWTGDLSEGSHTIAMPSAWGVYDFDHWEDMSTNPTRAIDLTSDMTVTAYYLKRQWTLTVTSDPISGIDFTVDGLTQTTPWSGLIDEGDHIIEMPVTWDIYDFDHWEDTSVNPSRTISLTGDTTVTAYYVKRQWTLTVNSDPIDGVDFTLDDATYATQWSSLLDEGSYTVVMPQTWTVDTNEYVFDHWEDASTNPTRTISLTSDLSITAYYILAPKYWTLTVYSEPISGIEFIIDSALHMTPWSDSMLEGTYIIVMPSEWIVDTDVYSFDQWEDGSTNPTRSISLTEDIAITATYELYVPVYGWIDGYVTDSVTGDALAGATVTIDGVSDLTDAEGYYNIEVTPGTYAVTASAVGYESQSKSATVTAGETTTVDFALSPAPFSIDSLIAEVEEFYSLGDIDEEGIKDSLMDKLVAAKEKIDAGQIHVAKNILRAFRNHVKAQLGKHITVEAADILLTDAQYIMDNL